MRRSEIIMEIKLELNLDKEYTEDGYLKVPIIETFDMQVEKALREQILKEE